MLADKPPRIRRTHHNTQLTYNLPSRVHDVKTYPVLSPQGATIIFYGHDKGVTVVWRGGRRFKAATTSPNPPPPAAAAAAQKPNSTVDGSIIIVDDDEDDKSAVAAATRPFRDAPEFEDEVDDTLHPEVVQTLELGVGGAVLHIAALPMAPCAAEDAGWGGVDMLKERMVFAVSCASNDAYVVTLPLTPPSPESKARPELRRELFGGRLGSGTWGETVVFLQGLAAQVHGLAAAIVRPKTLTAASRMRDGAGDALSTPKPRIVVAAHTREAAGVLRLWDVVLDLEASAEAGSVAPFQTEYLPNFASTISFNPTHLTQLLVVFPQQAVRIYDYALPSIFPVDPSTGPFPSTGSWLLSLYAPFSRPAGNRKPITDAAWIAHGRAVLTLLADGMWGVWDIDGANPSASTLLGKVAPGLRGAAITAFSTSGYVEGTGSFRGAGPAQAQAPRPGEFVPMTPHTRRDAAASFHGAASPPSLLAAVRGGISVTSLPTARASADEAAVLWIGGLEHVCVIPGVSRFWDAQVRKGAGGGVNLFSGAQPTRMVRLHDLSTGLLGERCCGVEALLNPDSSSSRQRDGDCGGLPIDVLVRGETRIVIVRDTDESATVKIGESRRRAALGDRLFAGRPAAAAANAAIIVHGAAADRKAFNLSVSKPGILKLNRFPGGGASVRERMALSPVASEDIEESPTRAIAVARPRRVLSGGAGGGGGGGGGGGFSFMDTLSAAADVTEDDARRDIETEMLDIMDLDRALDDMEHRRESGRKRVFFDES